MRGRTSTLDVIDAHVEALIKRNPEAFQGLVDYVAALQKGQDAKAQTIRDEQERRGLI